MSVRCNFSFVLRVLGSDPLFDMCLWAHFDIQNEACLQPLPPARLPAAARCVCVCAYTNASGAVWGTGYRHERGGGVCVFILCSFFVYSLFYPMTPPLRTRFLLLQMPYCSPCVCLGGSILEANKHVNKQYVRWSDCISFCYYYTAIRFSHVLHCSFCSCSIWGNKKNIPHLFYCFIVVCRILNCSSYVLGFFMFWILSRVRGGREDGGGRGGRRG
jgi:hypothetical protein